MRYPCPVCRTPDAIIVTMTFENDRPSDRTISSVKTTCGCQLPAAQETDIKARAWREAMTKLPDDRPWDVPSFSNNID